LNDLVRCPKCGEAVHIGKMDAEISEIGVTDHNVGFVVRKFQAMCPHCGPFFHDRVGHHGTITKKQMAQLFPKRHRRRLRDALPEVEQREFMRTMSGKREPKEGEVENWLAVQAEIMRGKGD
jgi:ribosomal protein S27AE